MSSSRGVSTSTRCPTSATRSTRSSTRGRASCVCISGAPRSATRRGSGSSCTSIGGPPEPSAGCCSSTRATARPACCAGAVSSASSPRATRRRRARLWRLSPPERLPTARRRRYRRAMSSTESTQSPPARVTPDRPWVMRTYAGHSSAAASNALYRRNLAKGQTGLSVAFDLPTQTGYDPDHVLSRGEVGKVGVPISHIGDMAALFADIPLREMNTSMTINATAMWLLALYQVAAERQAEAAGEDPAEWVHALAGTTQNDIIKEYLSRGTYVFPPAPSLRLITDMVAYTVREIPKWNPINICSYHLQEAGATPVQEIAFAMSTAVAVLDAVRDSGQVPPEEFPSVVARISFFVKLWDELTRERYGVTEAKARRFRYGVQVNSLGLTEAQPENNVQRIVLEMLGVTLSKDARARAIQLPCWNEALGLPTPWDQQWSLRIQQVLAYESDLLEYGDLFEGSVVVERKVAEMCAAAEVELQWVLDGGGSFSMIDQMKARIVQSHAERVRRIESGEQVVVGQTRFTETEESPLTADAEGGILVVDPQLEAEQIEALRRWRSDRDQAAVEEALAALARTALAEDGAENLMVPTIAA